MIDFLEQPFREGTDTERQRIDGDSMKQSRAPIIPLLVPCPSRRAFCQVAAAGIAGAATLQLVGCTGGGFPDDGGGMSVDDAGNVIPPPDLTGMQQGGGSCPGGVTDTHKAAASFTLNTATFFRAPEVFVCRDAGGLYALSSICPHAGCDVTFRSSTSGFRCPCHGAVFDFNGAHPTRPAFSPLDHYALCLSGAGTVAFDLSSTVDATQRYNF